MRVPLDARAIAYSVAGEFMPLYAVYALVFRDNGLSTAQISSLFVIWSVTTFVLEIPSGAWADTVSRRKLLVVASLIYGCAFTAWLTVPTYWGFAAGFALWGVSSAMQSGTYEALIYDELARVGRDGHYAALMGYIHSASMVSTLLAYAVAAPILALGGGDIAVVGWFSVAMTLVQAVLAASLPDPPDADPPPSDEEVDDFADGYVAMLKQGLGEAAHSGVVRRAVVFVALLMGLLAFDEYFTLAADDDGAPLAWVPFLVALPTAGQVLGTALAGRTAHVSNRTVTVMLVGSAVALGVLPFVGLIGGFVCLTIAYGVMYNLMIVAEARLQGAIEGSARATVTSVSGLLSEVFAVTVFAYFALGSGWATVMPLVGLLAIPTVGLAVAARPWLPPPRDR